MMGWAVRARAGAVMGLAAVATLAGCDTAAPRYRGAALPAAPCPVRMVLLPDGASCIDVREASIVAGRAEPAVAAPPASVVLFVQASQACRAAGFRLCTGTEWSAACGGTEARRYPYGEAYEAGRCNTAEPTSDLSQIHVQPSGAFTRCVSPEGVFDLSGNVGEWTDERDVSGTLRELRGGAARNGESNVRCVLDDRGFQPPESVFEGQGFRCCADAQR
jgi:formylglycine-generating enzyme required for sulfatase activity